MNIDKFLAEVPKNVDGDERLRKRARGDEDEGSEDEGRGKNGRMEDGEDEDEQARIMRLLEEEPPGEEFDLQAMRRQVVALEKRVTKNQEMRVKYADQPTKFLESEAELHEEIQKAHVLATAPDLYPDLVDTRCLGAICSLLVHENTDISIAVVDLLREMTDEDAVADSQDEAKALVDALLEADLLELLLQNLHRLNESVREDADGVQNTLGVIENICVLKPELCKQLFHETKFLSWLKGRLRQKQFDANKLYASEILAIMLQDSDENRKLFGDEEGIDMLLRNLAYYRNRDPKTSEEIELLNNYFDALCSCLLRSENKTKFLQGEGIELMIIMLRENKLSVFGAMKTLSYAMSGFETAQCKRFVEKLGLKSLFPRFMKTPKRGEKGAAESEFEEHVCTVIASLLKNINDSKLRPRILNKFVEDDYAKIERLIELHHKFSERVKVADRGIEEEKKELEQEEIEIDDDVRDMFYLRRLDAGLFSLQLVDYILAQICTAGVPPITRRVRKLLSQSNRSLDDVVDVLKEYADNVGGGKESGDAEKERRHLLDLVAKLDKE
eukprot:comp22722_c0_seq1/m.35338 comp22722_c0_seq1/g.35338  ORF comp22722_c0_seq1/g.35338 comp22722_c0_seq1/m.35338 type:complete len:557 (-) comp22722_c0_seq1:67-1737(-)